MNMNKALQNLYHAVSGSTTTKVNISKLLVDIHYAITGVESSVKNNWSRIIDSMATNWPEGGGGSSDFSTATVTVTNNVETTLCAPFVVDVDGYKGIFVVNSNSGEYDVALYKGMCQATFISSLPESVHVAVTGNITYNDEIFFITGDCTITIS